MELLTHCETLFADWVPLHPIDQKKDAKWAAPNQMWLWHPMGQKRTVSVFFDEGEWGANLYEDVMKGTARAIRVARNFHVTLDFQPTTIEACKELLTRFALCPDTWQN
jgi:hypothetical protein